MRIVVIGASGTIGRAVCGELEARHEIVKVGRSRGDATVDISDASSIRAMYARIGAFDALVCAAGKVTYKPLEELDDAAYEAGLRDKLLGQVNLVRLGLAAVREAGSFTLVAGVLSQDPIVSGAAASMVNGALESWVRAAAIELPRGVRVNVVSPTVLVESMATYAQMFRGFEPVPAARVGRAFAKSVEGKLTGQVLRVV